MASLFFLLSDQYSDHYKPTIGADFVYKELMFEGKLVKLQFWDLSGQYVGSKEVCMS